MKLRNDTVLWRVRLVWLGWDGFTLPFQLPYQWYGLFAAIWLTLSLPCCFLFGLGALGPTGGVSLLATTAVFKYVSPERPVRKVIHTAVTDWRRSRPELATPAAMTKLSARHITIATEEDR